MVLVSASRRSTARALCLALTLAAAAFPQTAVEPCREDVKARIRIEVGHPWRPPFGLERVGKPLEVVVDIEVAGHSLAGSQTLTREYFLAGYRAGKQVERHVLNVQTVKSRLQYRAVATFETYPSEIALEAMCRPGGHTAEVTRISVPSARLEAEAEARPREVINPVDLGAILVPADWLLLRGGQSATVEVAAIDRSGVTKDASVRVWWESAPRRETKSWITLTGGNQVRTKLVLTSEGLTAERDRLLVSITDPGGKLLWVKQVRTMLVREPPRLPAFGVTELKLRYDAPISVRDSNTGHLSTMDYSKAWDPSLSDVVVTFPTGARFVFWRGSSYIPFWAGRHNTGFSYEWAETTPPPDGFMDSVEPLMDKELRYGRVRIIESTAARVHVRWTYQSCDFKYKVWGDAAAEDFYFYPDGFGTRVLTLRSTTGAEYEVSEFIILTPAAAYPLDVLPRQLVDVISIDGETRTLSFPHIDGPAGQGKNFKWTEQMRERAKSTPVLYRVRIHKQEDLAAIYFSPLDKTLPSTIYAPFFDRGYLVTPNYWGSHWPLARGKTTGGSIDDRFFVSPAHNSIMTWGYTNRPTPLSTGQIQSIDTLGRSRPIDVRRWAWLIGMTDASKSRLLDWARSFTQPASLDLVGARLAFEAYVPERRAFRLQALSRNVTITIKPEVRCVNPVFEIATVWPALLSATLGTRTLRASEYAWDGKSLWLDATIDEAQALKLRFGAMRAPSDGARRNKMDREKP
jgi:hypothetical protein